MKKILAILLIAALLLTLCACKPPEELMTKSRQAVENMLFAIRENKEDYGFSLMYPGTVTEKEFHEPFTELSAALPCDEDYTLELQTWEVTKKVGTEDQWFVAQYSLVWGDGSFIIDTTYCIGERYEGLLGFNISLADGK